MRPRMNGRLCGAASFENGRKRCKSIEAGSSGGCRPIPCTFQILNMWRRSTGKRARACSAFRSISNKQLNGIVLIVMDDDDRLERRMELPEAIRVDPLALHHRSLYRHRRRPSKFRRASRTCVLL